MTKHNSTNGTTSALVNGSAMIEGTNLSEGDAGAMHKDYLRDQRIARLSSGAPHGKRRGSRKTATSIGAGTSTTVGATNDIDTLEAETGWSRADAVEAAIEARSDLRRYGHYRIYN
jgi:hypothetical protein